MSTLPSSSAADCKPEEAGLWEDGMLMGFMPLKDAISMETSLATPTLYKLTSEVKIATYLSSSLTSLPPPRQERRQQGIMRLVLLSHTCRRLSSHAHYNEDGVSTSVTLHSRREVYNDINCP